MAGVSSYRRAHDVPSVRLPVSVLAICALVFCAELGQSMLVPLCPRSGASSGSRRRATGALLSAATLATLAAAVPAGLLAERLGALLGLARGRRADRAVAR